MLPLSALLNPASPPSFTTSPQTTLALQDVRAQIRSLSQLLDQDGPILVPDWIHESLELVLLSAPSSRTKSLANLDRVDPVNHVALTDPLPHPKTVTSLSHPISTVPFALASGHLLSPPEIDVRATQRTTINKLYRYDEGTIVEYPETSANGYIGHLFKLDPNHWVSPSDNFVYAQGVPKGASPKNRPVFCFLLRDDNGELIPCREFHSTCE